MIRSLSTLASGQRCLEPNGAVEKAASCPYSVVNQWNIKGQMEPVQMEPAMARYKHIDTRPRFLAVNLKK